MDIVRLFEDYNVDFVTEGHKHCRSGWANTKCPFCTGNEGYHLGWNLQEEYFFCWRCAWHPPVQTVAQIINVTQAESATILQRYGINMTKLQKTVKQAEKPLILPTAVTPLTPQHKQYLRGRGFDPDMLEQKWGLQSTGPLSYVDHSPYKFRILIPFYWNGQLVTFDTRDTTGRAEEKYKACPLDRAVIDRKKIIYGNQEAWTDTGICVEGELDVWRFGDPAFATCGINFKPEQVRVISRIFKRVYIAYDTRSKTSKELQAQQQARKLRSELRMRGVKAEIVDIGGGDPAEMTQKDADKFVKSLLH